MMGKTIRREKFKIHQYQNWFGVRCCRMRTPNFDVLSTSWRSHCALDSWNCFTELPHPLRPATLYQSTAVTIAMIPDSREMSLRRHWYGCHWQTQNNNKSMPLIITTGTRWYDCMAVRWVEYVCATNREANLAALWNESSKVLYILMTNENVYIRMNNDCVLCFIVLQIYIISFNLPAGRMEMTTWMI